MSKSPKLQSNLADFIITRGELALVRALARICRARLIFVFFENYKKTKSVNLQIKNLLLAHHIRILI